MHFIDDVNLVATKVGGEIDLVTQVAHIIHAGIGGSVDLYQIKEAPLVNRQAVCALVARPVGQILIQTVDCFCQDAGSSGFTGAARARK